jgi:hypothetical protein
VLCGAVRRGTRAAWRSNMRRSERYVQESQRGGDSATGSGGGRAGNAKRSESCAENRKKITSRAAIVASQRGKGGQGVRSVLITPVRPAFISCRLPVVSACDLAFSDNAELYTALRSSVLVLSKTETALLKSPEPLEQVPSSVESIRRGLRVEPLALWRPL